MLRVAYTKADAHTLEMDTMLNCLAQEFVRRPAIDTAPPPLLNLPDSVSLSTCWPACPKIRDQAS